MADNLGYDGNAVLNIQQKAYQRDTEVALLAAKSICSSLGFSDSVYDKLSTTGTGTESNGKTEVTWDISDKTNYSIIFSYNG